MQVVALLPKGIIVQVYDLQVVALFFAKPQSGFTHRFWYQ